MIPPFVVLVLSGSLVLLAPGLLGRLTSRGRRPLVSLIAWQVTIWSALAGFVMAAALAARPTLEMYVHVPFSLHSCIAMLRTVTRLGQTSWLQIAGAALVVAILLRLVVCGTAEVITTHRRRATHRVLLDLVGLRDPSLDAHVVNDEVPFVYCVPGHGGCVVFTSAAVSRLSDKQRTAVLAHEHAHLTGRHHLLVASTAIVSRAFPNVSVFVQARDQTARLVEMRADDMAARCHGRLAVAEALLSLADVPSPTGALAATGVSTAVRVERLVLPAARRVRAAASDIALALCTVVLVAAPLGLAVAGHAVICQL